ncbi:hypothetical protein C7N43_00270 [Sphingobacteriales bacterium UPWRP_1]|nr:hypothetical protein BVG80_15200 [Sphingobacteriales bacterium TSM_CSM]PSJ79096.1 hypothetical protein C7N43_00270 [Sphingobacteriales bacterium UPWRP_1]
MATLNHEDLGIYSSVPASERAVQRLTKVLYYLFLHPTAIILGDIVWILAGIAAVSWAFRQSGSMVWSLLLSALLAGVAYGYSIVLNRYIFPWFLGQFFGKPVFGRLGGMDRFSFFTLLKTAQKMRIDIKDTDKPLSQQFCELDNDLTEAMFKERYFALYAEQAQKEGIDLEAEWKNLWETKMLSVGTDNVTFNKARVPENLAFRMMPLKLQFASSLISPFIKFFQLIGICLLATYLTGFLPLLSIIQVLVALNLILSVFWYMIYSYNMSEVQLLVPDESVLSPGLFQQFAGRLQSMEHKSLRPLNITVENSFFTDIRRYQLRYIICFTLLNSLFVLLMLLVAYLAHLALGNANPYALSWYLPFAAGALLLPVAFYMGFYFISIIIQHFRKVLGSLLVGITTAVLPFFIYYLIKGQFQISEVQNGIWAALSGITTVLSTIVASQFKEILESEPKTNKSKEEDADDK